MSLRMRALALLIATGLLLVSSSSRAGVIQLLGPGDFLSTNTETQDFEATVNGTVFTFDPTASRALASMWSDSVTTSGIWGLLDDNEPLTATFSQDVLEVGLFFGNDDFGLVLDVVLSAFDAGNALLGTVQVTSNANDFVDQFIGIRSDMGPIRSVQLSYSRPQAQQLSVFIDDFTVGLGAAATPTAIPEPTSWRSGPL